MVWTRALTGDGGNVEGLTQAFVDSSLPSPYGGTEVPEVPRYLRAYAHSVMTVWRILTRHLVMCSLCIMQWADSNQ